MAVLVKMNTCGLREATCVPIPAAADSNAIFTGSFRAGITWRPTLALSSHEDIPDCKAEEHPMKTVSDVMTRDVYLASPDQTIREVAGAMAKADVGSLPVGENDRLVGMITDRDIVLRAVAKGLDPKTPVRDVMTGRIQYCYEDDDVVGVAENMAHLGVRRLAVLNHDKRLVGIVALSNVANCGEAKAASKLLKGVAEPHRESRRVAAA